MLHWRADLARLRNLAALGFTVTLSDLMTLRRMPERLVVATDQWVEDVVEEEQNRRDAETGTWRTGY